MIIGTASSKVIVISPEWAQELATKKYTMSYLRCFIWLLKWYWIYSYNYDAFYTSCLLFNWMLHINWGGECWWLCSPCQMMADHGCQTWMEFSIPYGNINGRPWNEVFTSLFVRRQLSALPSNQKKLSWLSPSVRPPPSNLGSIQYSGVNPKFALNCIGLAPGPRSDVGRRRGAMSGEVSYGRSVCRSEGSRTVEGIVRWRTADGRKFWLLFKTA